MTDDPLIGEEVGGYRVVERIGMGGMGSVYRAVLDSIGAQVAIKVLSGDLAGDPALAARFVAEARLANAVRHDGLVNVIGLGVLDDGRPYMIMEYLVGESLYELTKRLGRLPFGTLCGLICEALQAIAPMHARSIVHRDLKPSNLFVTTSGRLKVIDFGLAKLTTHLGMTRTGQVFGTPGFMAPEQLRDEPLDGRTDLYAIGVVLFECVTGRLPFQDQPLDALHQPAPSAVVLVPEFPPAADAVMRKAMHPERDRRYADARDMELALRDAMGKLPADAFGSVVGLARDPISPIKRRAALPSDPTAGPEVDTQDLRGHAKTVKETPRAEADSHDLLGHAKTVKEAPSRLGKYELLGELGHGGEGVVMRAFDPAIDRRVALKILHDTKGARRERLIAEARAMGKVVHPNVVTLYDLVEADDQLVLAMELVDGSDVARWLRERRRSWTEIVDVFMAAGRGLAAAHGAGVIHRDFKPTNVLLGLDGRPRVSDFGLAHEGRGGTPAYMAPEQLIDATTNTRSDQFAFCASLWESLHGELPFPGDTAIAIATAARAGTLRAPTNTEVPAAFTAVLARGLSGLPDGRFQTMPELLDAMAASIAPRQTPVWIYILAAAAALTGVTIFLATRHDPVQAVADARLPTQPAIIEPTAQVDARPIDAIDAKPLIDAHVNALPAPRCMCLIAGQSACPVQQSPRCRCTQHGTQLCTIAFKPCDPGAPRDAPEGCFNDGAVYCKSLGERVIVGTAGASCTGYLSSQADPVMGELECDYCMTLDAEKLRSFRGAVGQACDAFERTTGVRMRGVMDNCQVR